MNTRADLLQSVEQHRLAELRAARAQLEIDMDTLDAISRRIDALSGLAIAGWRKVDGEIKHLEYAQCLPAPPSTVQ